MRCSTMHSPGAAGKVGGRPCVRYAVPNELRSHEDFLRRYHLDLPHLDDRALWRERKQVRFALAYWNGAEGPDLWNEQLDREWLEERLLEVDEELRRRQARQDARRLTGRLS